MPHVFVGNERIEMQSTPPMQPYPTEQPQRGAGFVFPIRPQSGGPHREFKIVCALAALHKNGPRRNLPKSAGELDHHLISELTRIDYIFAARKGICSL